LRIFELGPASFWNYSALAWPTPRQAPRSTLRFEELRPPNGAAGKPATQKAGKLRYERDGGEGIVSWVKA
jgi:hypothetical protein